MFVEQLLRQRLPQFSAVPSVVAKKDKDAIKEIEVNRFQKKLVKLSCSMASICKLPFQLLEVVLLGPVGGY